MCGIAGILKLDGSGPEPGVLQAMIGMLAHRGPDASGVHCDGLVGLAHARLSIIDLTGGAQPMANADGSLWITFNGEVFNSVELRAELQTCGARFATRSDTEVILHLYERYGQDCVHRLNGQWAFAIWDARRRSLFLSRDRMGIRPLFYVVNEHEFLFSSEIKALFAHPHINRELDLNALNEIFMLWTTITPRTAFRGVYEIPPAHSLLVEGGKVSIRRYWAIGYEPEVDFDDAVAAAKSEELLVLLQDATRIRLRSDVPVGAYLSGGLDSTVISAIVKQLRPVQLKTFSVTFDDAPFDEANYQRDAVSYLETEHAEIRCAHSDIVRSLPDVIWHAEAPLLRTAPAPLFMLSRFVRDAGLKVVLTGEGADELLGGYDIFKEAKVRRFWARYPQSNQRSLLLRRLYPYLHNLSQQPAAYLQSWFRAAPEDLANPFFSHLPRWQLTSKLRTFFSDDVKSALAKNDPRQSILSSLPKAYFSWPALCQAQYLESAHLLPGYILSSQGDRMAMAHSVEGRYPFLDCRIVEFAAKLHPNLKLKVLDEKYLLKLAAGKMVPGSIRRRAKQPYRAPGGRSFFVSGTDSYVRDLLSPEAIVRNGIFDVGAVIRLVSKFRNGIALGEKDDMALVAVLSTQLLTEQFISGFGKLT